MSKEKRIQRLEEREKDLLKKAGDLAYKATGSRDTYHSTSDEGPNRLDRRIKRIENRAERKADRAERLRKKLKGKDYMGNPLNYSEGLVGGDTFDDYIVEETVTETSPLGYGMNVPKATSPNNAFSSKDFDLITQLQNNYNVPSEGSFKTSSQNLYASLESPLAFRGMNAAFKQEGVPTGATMSLKMGDRRAAQKAQELQNWSTKMSVVTDMIAGVGSIAGSVAKASDRRLKKDIKLIGLSPAGLKIYSFKYKNSEDSYQGVMSDEIPSYAVVKNTDGYDMVDYSKLDVEFKKI